MKKACLNTEMGIWKMPSSLRTCPPAFAIASGVHLGSLSLHGPLYLSADHGFLILIRFSPAI